MSVPDLHEQKKGEQRWGLAAFAVVLGVLVVAGVAGWWAMGWDDRAPAPGGLTNAVSQAALPVPTDEEGLRATTHDPLWLARGESVFAGLCRTCHGNAGGGTLQGPALNDGQWIIEPTMTSILGVIRNGRPGTAMQPMRDFYRADELVAVAAYVADLSRRGGPTERKPEGLHGPIAW